MDTNESRAESWAHAPLAAQLLDENGCVIAANDEWERLTGYSAQEWIGRPYKDLVPAEHLSDFERNMEELTSTGHLDGAPCFIQPRTGPKRNVLVFSRVDTDSGSPIARCMLVDSTDLLETERRLAESESRFRNLFELAPTPIVIHDGKDIAMANAAAARFLGFADHAALVGRPVADFVHPDARPAIAERVKRMLTEDWVAPLSEERYVTADGRTVYGETIASPVQVGGQRLIHVVALDQSGRRSAEAALADSEARFRNLFDTSPDAIVVHDGVSARLANPAARRHFGIGETEAITGLKIRSFVHPDSWDLVVGRLQRLMSGDESTPPVELRLRAVDGSEWEAEAVTSVLRVGDERLMQTTFRDLTERKRTERELARYREELERLVAERTQRLNRAREDLTAITAVVGRTVEVRDPYTAGHQRRVAELSVAIARQLGFDGPRVEMLEVAARMHDIGKVSVPAEILSKPSRLSALEYELVKGHAQAGFDILDSASLHDPIAEIVYQHHERLDGSGYPRGLRADSLLPESRVLMVADVFEAMVSHRPYRPSLGAQPAIEELLAGRGTRYDADVVDACMRLHEDGFEFTEV